MKGDICWNGQPDCYDQKSAKFIETSFYALKKITPKNTIIVAGQPNEAAAAGASMFKYEADPYNAMAAAFKNMIDNK